MYYPYLEHSGVKGMRWGVRRYQNHDGSLTPAGRAHYGVGPARKIGKSIGSALKKAKKGAGRVTKSMGKTLKNIKTNRAAKREERAERKLNKAVAKGDVKKILKRVDRMSDAELKAALNRARDVKMMKDLRQPKTPLSEKVGNVATAVTKTAGAFNAIAKARRERLAYKKEKEAYEREEDERAEKERKAWEEEKARKKAEKEAKKTPLERVEGEVIDDRPAKKPKSIYDDDVYRRLTGPSYTPNWSGDIGSPSSGPKRGRGVAGLLPDLSTPSKPKKDEYVSNILNSIGPSTHVPDYTTGIGKKALNSREGARSVAKSLLDSLPKKKKKQNNVSVEELTTDIMEGNREKLKRLGFL